MKLDKEILTKYIADSARIAFTKIIKEKPDEQFFSFVLLTLDDVLSCYAYANSFESHERTITENGVELNSVYEEDYKWSPVEWEYADIAREEFDKVYDYSDKIQSELGENDFYQYKLDFLQCMENAFIQLDKEGLFGTEKDRDEITLFMTISDSFMSEEVEEQSCEKLNSSLVNDKFKTRFKLQKLAEQNIQNEKETIKNKVSKFLVRDQINYWIKELDHILKEESSDVLDSTFDFKNEFILDCLLEIGEKSALPLLNYLENIFSHKYSKYDMDTLSFDILKYIPRFNNRSVEVHEQLRKLFKNWIHSEFETTTGFHLSNTLFLLFDYPEPDFYEKKYENFVKIFKQQNDI